MKEINFLTELQGLIKDGPKWIRIEQTSSRNSLFSITNPQLAAGLSTWKLISIEKIKSFEPATVDIINAIKTNYNSADMILNGLKITLSRLENNTEETSLKMDKSINKLNSKKIFIIHGHDDAAKESTARHLVKLGLEPIILHEQANNGRTIIEKFEGTANGITHAIALFTPDDKFVPKSPSEPSVYRARQNVIFELGYFVGKLGRGNVTVLYKKGVEIPSDYFGVIYIEMDDYGAWKTELAKELHTSGISIDSGALL